MPFQTLSIIVPCFNEEKLVSEVLKKIISTKLDWDLKKEIIVVDDGSTDRSVAAIEDFIQKTKYPIKLIKHLENKGKGASIKSGLNHVGGEITIIQDADMEYDTSEYNKLLGPIIKGFADVVYGSRFRGSEPHRVLFFFHTVGNRLLTFWSNIFTGLNLTDMETGFKMFRTEIIRSITLYEDRFGFEPEITAKVSRMKNIRIYEVGISYYGRRYEEGKKIHWIDGMKALYCVLKYNIFYKK